MRPVVSGKTPYVRFDRNSYSIPHTHVRRPLTLLASATRVRLVAGADEVARHVRSYDTGQTIEDLAHLEGLLAATRQANPSTGRDRLRLAVPAIGTLFERLAARGESLRAHINRLLGLLDDYGPRDLAAAVAAALERDALGADAIAHLLDPSAAGAGSPRRCRSPCPTGPASAISMSPRMPWSPTMTLPDPIPTTLSDHLRQLGLTQTATEVNDFIARATQKRWSPVVLLETLVRAELDARARQRVERRLKEARVGRFKP